MKTLVAALFWPCVILAIPLTDESAFCAVELSVTLPDGSAVTSGTAVLIDSSGDVVQTAQVRRGQTAFCDLDFGTYSIRVAQTTSIPVTLLGVKAVYGHRQRLGVVLNPAPDVGSGGGGGNACRAYVRVATPDGKPVQRAKVISNGVAGETDDFGRVLLLVPLGRFTTFRFEKIGFGNVDSTFSCSRSSDYIERRVYFSR
jgi:hypothetical protein